MAYRLANNDAVDGDQTDGQNHYDTENDELGDDADDPPTTAMMPTTTK